nr:hypothetical protein [Tanacetum cinerariifolium]
MSLTFTDTHNMIAFLSKSDASEGKKVIIIEATIRDALRLDDAEGIECLTNEAIFIELARIGVGKGCSEVETPLFEGMIVAQQVGEGVAEVNVEDVSTAGVAAEGDASATDDEVPAADKIAQALEITKLKQWVKKLERRHKASKLRRIKKDVVAVAKDVQDAEIEEHSGDVDIEPVELQEVVEVVTTAKLITEVVTTASTTITAAALQLTTSAAPTLTNIPSAARRRNRVVIRDLEETATPSTIIHTEAKSKDKGKAELNKNIDWDEVIDHVQRKDKEDNDVKRYQALKRKPQTEAQSRKNMIIYLRNVAEFKMDYFKGTTYDDIRPIIENKFNSNVAFLQKKKIPNDEDGVYTEATPLARKVPVVDYENNKPYHKIIRADGSPQLILSSLSLIRKFDREDLEVLWELVKERFASSKPKNFSNDFLLTTLTYMFEKPDVQAQL